MVSSPESALTYDRIEYLDQAAASDPGRDYKRQLLARLELRPGQRVLDVGCGPGTDLLAMADAVADNGLVIGVDNDPAMAAEAKRRMATNDRIEIREGDAHALPIDEASIDRTRADRVLQHVADPVQVLMELRRVVRVGGLIALAEPDWDTLILDDRDVRMSRCYSRFVATQVVRNAAIGRQLARLAGDAGFVVRTMDVKPVVFREFAAANKILRTPSVVERAIQAQAMPADAASEWLERLANGPFLAVFTFFVVSAEAV